MDNFGGEAWTLGDRRVRLAAPFVESAEGVFDRAATTGFGEDHPVVDDLVLSTAAQAAMRGPGERRRAPLPSALTADRTRTALRTRPSPVCP